MSLGARHAVAREPLPSWFQVDSLEPRLQRRFSRCADQAHQWMCDQPGFMLLRGRLGIVLPRAFAGADSPATTADAFALVRSLSLYRNEAKRTSVSERFDELASSGVDADGDDLDHVEVAMELWADYRKHGPLRVLARRTGPNVRGRIDWPATIRRTPALHGPHGVVYGQAIRTRTAIRAEDPLTALHIATAGAAGALLGASAHTSPSDGTKARQLLERVEHELYADRARRVHGLLHRFHAHRAGQDGTETQPIAAVFATSFAHVWERMVVVALGASSPKDMSNGYYCDNAGGRSSGLRVMPDGVVEARVGGQRVQIIMDAKHYKHGDLPGSESINKQIVYRLMLSDLVKPNGLPVGRIANSFVTPVVAPSGRPVRVACVHEVASDVGGLARICVVEVDLRRVTAAYLRGGKDVALAERFVAEVVRCTPSFHVEPAKP